MSSIGCGTGGYNPDGEVIAVASEAVSVWPTVPPVASHNQNNPNQQCQLSCAGGAGAGNRCPCVLNPPPGARWCDNYGGQPHPGVGEAAIYSDEWEGFDNWGQCVIIPAGVQYDYFWLALNGWESTWSTLHPGWAPTGIVQALLGPKTVIWFSSHINQAHAGSDGWALSNYSTTAVKPIYPASHGGCNVAGPYFYTNSCDPYGDLEMPPFPTYWIGSVFSEQVN